MIAVWLERIQVTGRVKTLGYHPFAENVEDIDLRPHIIVESTPVFKSGFDMYYNFDNKEFEYIKAGETKPFTIEDLYKNKQNEILSNCYADIYGSFTFQENQFACDATARDDINDLYYASQKDNFVSRCWFTLGGESVILITKELVVPFKDAVVQWKDDCWNKYAILSNQLKSIDLEALDAREQIEAINW